MYQVKKKDGTTEPFDRNKIVSGVVKAGASPEEAEKVAVEVETWVATLGSGATVEVVQIKEKVLEALRATNPTAVATFEAFKK